MGTTHHADDLSMFLVVSVLAAVCGSAWALYVFYIGMLYSRNNARERSFATLGEPLVTPQETVKPCVLAPNTHANAVKFNSENGEFASTCIVTQALLHDVYLHAAVSDKDADSESMAIKAYLLRVY